MQTIVSSFWISHLLVATNLQFLTELENQETLRLTMLLPECDVFSHYRYNCSLLKWLIDLLNENFIIPTEDAEKLIARSASQPHNRLNILKSLNMDLWSIRYKTLLELFAVVAEQAAVPQVVRDSVQELNFVVGSSVEQLLMKILWLRARQEFCLCHVVFFLLNQQQNEWRTHSCRYRQINSHAHTYTRTRTRAHTL